MFSIWGLSNAFLVLTIAGALAASPDPDGDGIFQIGNECFDIPRFGCTPITCKQLVGSACQTQCGNAALPRWHVSEPSVNLWLIDTPFRYNASRGKNVSFKLVYKNRQGPHNDGDTGDPKVFSLGSHWHTPWRAFVQPVTGESTNFWVSEGEGTALKYTLDKVHYATLAKLTQVSSTNVIQFPNGARSVYGFTTTVGGSTRYFLDRQEDARGNALQFHYVVTNDTIRLDQVIDVDNRTTTFEYVTAGNYSNMISKIIGPHGLTNIFKYDSAGRLTNITDIINVSSAMQYDGTNLTSLITPYGTNKFSYFTISNQMEGIRIEELGVRKHFFLYYAEVDGGKIPSDYLAYVPSTTNSPYYSIANTFDTTNTHQRNSFHWNPRQYENLSDLVRTNLDNGSFNVSNLASGDYLKCRQSHWLKEYGGTNVSMTVSLRREVSPNGSLQGQIKWFDYSSKEGGAADKEGTVFLPRFEAWKLPNGESQFILKARNDLGHPTNKIETYAGSGGTCQVRTNQYEYAANNIDLIRQVQLLGSSSRQVLSNFYNTAHQVLTNFDALGQTTVYTYNANQQLLTGKTPGGLTRSNVYNTSGTWSNFLASTIALEISQTNSFTYSNGNIFTHNNSRGLTATFTRDALDRITKTTYPDGTSISETYDKFDLVKVVDRMNCTNQYVYNGFRQRIQAIDPRGATTTYGYCNCGSLDSTTDPMGKATTFTYDLQGNRCVTTYPGAGSVTNNYNLMRQITNVIDSTGSSRTNCFNNQGLLCIVSNAFGCQSMKTYDIEDNTTEIVDANTVTNKFTYDDVRRMIRRVDGNGNAETNAYSALGLIAHANQLGQYTCYKYDVAARKTAETNGNGEVISFTYNAAGDLLTLTDGKSNVTTWKYDEHGRVTNKTDAAGTVILSYKYDADGRLTNRWSVAKGTTKYSYDSSGNLTNIDYPSSPDISMQYDASGRLTNMMDAVGTTKFTYTDSGALLTEDGPWDNDTLTYTYTTNRLRSKLSLLQPNATPWEQSYAYDGANRLTSLTSPAGTFGYLYDPGAHMQICKLTLPPSAYITNSFDALGRLTSTYLKNSGGITLNSHAYVYDNGSRRTRQTRTSGDYVDYMYDNIGQLKTAKGYESGGTTRLHEQLGYAYDAARNVNYRTNNGLIQRFNVNNLSQLTTVTRSNTLTVAGTTTMPASNVTVNALTATRYSDNTFAKDAFTLADGSNTFTAIAADSVGRWDTNTVSLYLPATNSFAYDGSGSLITNGARILEYDDENQLVRITEPNAWKSEFTYDGKMRRRIRKEHTWKSGNWNLQSETHYIYDGMLVIQERDGLNLPAINYTRGRDLSGSLERAGGIGGLLAFSDLKSSISSPSHFYYCADGNGNVTMLINTQQVAVAKYLYDSFGNALTVSGPLAGANLYRFSSKETHLASGLSYYLYRYYDANLHRWTNHDPIGERGGVNLYCMVGNNAMSRIDSFGLDWEWVYKGVACSGGICIQSWEAEDYIFISSTDIFGGDQLVSDRTEWDNGKCKCIRTQRYSTPHSIRITFILRSGYLNRKYEHLGNTINSQGAPDPIFGLWLGDNLITSDSPPQTRDIQLDPWPREVTFEIPVTQEACQGNWE